jgi:hypothetical protein
MNVCQYYLEHHLSPKDIEHNRKAIYNILKKLFKSENMKDIKSGDVKKTFELFDEVYFNKGLSKYLFNSNQNIKFSTSAKLSKTAGKCIYCETGYEIVISSKILASLFNKNEKQLALGGLTCRNRLECYINIFEHELIHFIIFLFCPKYAYPQHSKAFKILVYNLFGHTKTHHSLLLGDIDEYQKKLEGFEAKGKKVKKILKVGDHVKFPINKQLTKFVKGEVIELRDKRVIIKEFDTDKMWWAKYLVIEKI